MRQWGFAYHITVAEKKMAQDSEVFTAVRTDPWRLSAVFSYRSGRKSQGCPCQKKTLTISNAGHFFIPHFSTAVTFKNCHWWIGYRPEPSLGYEFGCRLQKEHRHWHLEYTGRIKGKLWPFLREGSASWPDLSKYWYPMKCNWALPQSPGTWTGKKSRAFWIGVSGDLHRDLRSKILGSSGYEQRD